MDDTNLLLNAALVWSELTGYKYQIVYGYKGKLRYIPLSFYSEDFSHLAGFQYLKDLALPKYNPKKILEKVLDTTITFEQVRKGMKYEVAV